MTKTLRLSRGVRRPHWGQFGVPAIVDRGNPDLANEAIKYWGAWGGMIGSGY